jgi:hypothetical protein
MNVVAAYHVFVCALFLVQGGMWTGYSQCACVLIVQGVAESFGMLSLRSLYY